jgi:hypothetical protein
MTHADPDEPARAAAIDFSRRLVLHWQKALGAELLGAYLIGSLAHAGFNRRYSDIDIALVTTAGLSPQALDRLRSGSNRMVMSYLLPFTRFQSLLESWTVNVSLPENSHPHQKQQAICPRTGLKPVTDLPSAA